MYRGSLLLWSLVIVRDHHHHIIIISHRQSYSSVGLVANVDAVHKDLNFFRPRLVPVTEPAAKTGKVETEQAAHHESSQTHKKGKGRKIVSSATNPPSCVPARKHELYAEMKARPVTQVFSHQNKISQSYALRALTCAVHPRPPMACRGPPGRRRLQHPLVLPVGRQAVEYGEESGSNRRIPLRASHTFFRDKLLGLSMPYNVIKYIKGLRVTRLGLTQVKRLVKSDKCDIFPTFRHRKGVQQYNYHHAARAYPISPSVALRTQPLRVSDAVFFSLFVSVLFPVQVPKGATNAR